MIISLLWIKSSKYTSLKTLKKLLFLNICEQTLIYSRQIHKNTRTTQRSRHTVVCQWPRKPCGTQVCYLQKPLIRRFQPLVSLITVPILCPPNTHSCILNLKNQPSSLRDMCSQKLPHFLYIFLFLHTILQKEL